MQNVTAQKTLRAAAIVLVTAAATAGVLAATRIRGRPSDEPDARWAALVQAAKREGVVRVAGPHGLPALKKALTEPFTAKFGIAVEYSDAGADDVLQRLEAVNGVAAPWDVFVGGNDTLMFKLKATGRLAPLDAALVLADAHDPGGWLGGALPFIDGDHLGVAFLKQASQFLYVNTERVRLDDITSYRDLLDPKWRGQILLGRDPRDAGSGQQAFSLFVSSPDLGPEFVRALVRTENLIIPKNSREADQLVRAARFAMCVCNNAQGTDLIARRLPYAKVDPHRLREGTHVTSSFANIALDRRAPHPNAAKVYLNWVLTRETGEAASRATQVPSARADVTKSFVPAQAVPDPSWPDVSNESGLEIKEEAARLALQLLGPKRP